VAALDAAVAGSSLPVVLAAHSLGCALVAHWAVSRDTCQGARALLVAPSDVEAAELPGRHNRASLNAAQETALPSIVVMSSDDQYVTPGRARQFAQAWGSRSSMSVRRDTSTAVRPRHVVEGFALVGNWRRPTLIRWRVSVTSGHAWQQGGSDRIAAQNEPGSFTPLARSMLAFSALSLAPDLDVIAFRLGIP